MADIHKTFRLKYKDLNITSSMLEEFMGYHDGLEESDPVRESIDEIIEMAESLCDIRAGYVITDSIFIDRENNKLICDDISFETKQIVTHQLRRSEKAAWFACTVGENISKYSNDLISEGDLLKGYVVDVMANTIIEASMDRIQEDLKSDMKKTGLKITNRYSPGYCNWNINEQKKLFNLLPENFLNISLNESCLMIPIKSISGIIGIGANVAYNEYTCKLCDDLACIYRNKKRG